MRLQLHYDLIDAIDSDSYESFYDSLDIHQRLDLLRYSEEFADGKSIYQIPQDFYDKYTVYTDVLKMTLTQFIYLEHEFSSGMTKRLISLIIRPKDETSFDDTTDSEEDHIKSLMEEDATVIMSVFKQLKANREFTLFTKFNGVIYTRYEPMEGEEEETRQTDPFTERWFWYAIVRRLANNDITKFDKIYELRMSDVLIDLAYQAQLAEVEENDRRAQEAAQAARYR